METYNKVVMKMLNLKWYINRLRLMSPAEVIFRIKNILQAKVEQLGLYGAFQIPKYNLSYSSNSWIYTDVTVSKPLTYLSAADKVLKGTISIFSFYNVNIGKIPDWNKDPSTGIKVPLLFGKSINYRDVKRVGNIRYLWEINRHHYLVCLGQAYHLSHNKKYLEGIKTLLQSWFEQCPYLKGPNWISSLELAIRLINWAVLWQYIGGKDSKLFEGQNGKIFLHNWLTSIYQHVHFIMRNFSAYSSANNHLIGEAAGVFIATLTWPYWRIFKKWNQKAKSILEEECLKQNGKDGVNLEQSTGYHQFALSFFLISLLAGKANRIDFSKNYYARIESMLEYLACLMDVNGNIPMIGDSDNGYVIKLSQEKNFSFARSLLAMGAVIFRRSDFKAKAQYFDENSLWLLGNKGKYIFEKIDINKSVLPIRRAFKEGGYFLLGHKWETENEVKIIIDCGPIGYLSISAHGHADALSIYLSIGGKEFLIDPGTYTYHAKERWRNYFRGTLAHNTVRVDKMDQSISGGPFMWLKKANASVICFNITEKQDLFYGVHNGYLRLNDPVLHKRLVIFDKTKNEVFIEDFLICKKEHYIEVFWHFSEKCNVWKENGNIYAENETKKICLTCLNSKDPLLIKGQENPPCGWISRVFDYKEPTWTAIFRKKIYGNTKLKTVIKILN